MKILQINSSARIDGSASSAVADAIVRHLRRIDPDAVVQIKNLARDPVQPLDELAVATRMLPPDARTPDQTARALEDERHVVELLAADIIVIGAPMYNFNIPSQLKNWIDAVAKPGATFRYTETGPIGLVKGKKAIIALTRGGFYRETPADTPAQYLRYMLGFLGITDVQFIYAEGMARGPEMTAKAFRDADEQILNLVA
ncbi:FMN-dependent NADH-azoreductase [Rhizobium phaseoli]|nr:FMN-dependent NADH-azoreductase [Rhizobium phaseoli]